MFCCRHEELIAAGNVYANMWQQQLQNNELEKDKEPEVEEKR